MRFRTRAFFRLLKKDSATALSQQLPRRLVVSPEHLANRFKDATLPAVLATPIMIMAMENAALNAIKPYFEPGESAVGTRVEVRHLAATPVGRRVTAFAEVTATTGSHIEFRVWAMDQAEEIGTGTHARVVIELDKFSERLATKYANKGDCTRGSPAFDANNLGQLASAWP